MRSILAGRPRPRVPALQAALSTDRNRPLLPAAYFTWTWCRVKYADYAQAAAAARPARRPEKRQPPRKVPPTRDTHAPPPPPTSDPHAPRRRRSRRLLPRHTTPAAVLRRPTRRGFANRFRVPPTIFS